jgi:hypothetical protein
MITPASEGYENDLPGKRKNVTIRWIDEMRLI